VLVQEDEALPSSDKTPGDTTPDPAFTIDSLEGALRQGEILSNITQYSYTKGGVPGTVDVDEQTHAFVVVATQDYDLLWNFLGRATLNGVLLYEAETEEKAIDRFAETIRGRKLWEPILRNNNERFHCLEAVQVDLDLVGQGIESLIIDFRRYFSLPPDELYRQLSPGGGAARRSRLTNPFKEHFQSRAAFYLQRVGLPRD
jgi:hypothetical protein